jgi:hypothetical protein
LAAKAPRLPMSLWTSSISSTAFSTTNSSFQKARITLWVTISPIHTRSLRMKRSHNSTNRASKKVTQWQVHSRREDLLAEALSSSQTGLGLTIIIVESWNAQMSTLRHRIFLIC